MKSEKEPSAPTEKKRVLAVGATGYLGAKVLRELTLAPDIVIRAMSRRDPETGAEDTVEWVRADMMNPASLGEAMKDIDVVVTTANGYARETIEADFEGNRNLIEAAIKAGVKRYVFLSIVACEHAESVPHFHAKKVAEDRLKKSGLPYVFVRAPAFLDQSEDRIADMVEKGRIGVIGDRETRWSYVLTDDLAVYLAKAVTHPTDDIDYQSIDVGWSDGPNNQNELIEIVSQITGKTLKPITLPWWLLRLLVLPAKLFSDSVHDMLRMFLFLKSGLYVSDITGQERFFGPAPASFDSIRRWAVSKGLATK